MKKPLQISEARSRLPELAKRLVRSPGAVEYIAHRDLDETLALTTESHLRYLEDTVAELRRKLTKPFTLGGSMASELDDAGIEKTLDAVRAEAGAAEESRARDVGA